MVCLGFPRPHGWNRVDVGKSGSGRGRRVWQVAGAELLMAAGVDGEGRRSLATGVVGNWWLNGPVAADRNKNASIYLGGILFEIMARQNVLSKKNGPCLAELLTRIMISSWSSTSIAFISV